MAQDDDELLIAACKFFALAWNEYTDGTPEDMQGLIENTVFVEQVEATQEDVDGGDLPEGCEVGDYYYQLTALGHRAWDVAQRDILKEKDEA